MVDDSFFLYKRGFSRSKSGVDSYSNTYTMQNATTKGIHRDVRTP